jgi:glycerophosphoryl diester phosphodiesterase
MMTLREFVRSTPFFIIAHRGASGEAPENTIASVRIALEGGAKMVEVDLQVSHDDQLMVFHDNILGRTTNGHGYVKNHDATELRSLDAGAWFGPQFAGEPIPFLHEILDLIKDRAYLNLEIKPMQEDPNALQTIAKAIGIIKERGLQAYTVFASFDHHALAAVKEIDPTLHTCALNVPGDTRLPSDILTACHADAFGCSIHELTHKRADDCAEHQIPWGVYTVNTVEDLHKALAYGVSAVVSNYPNALASP